MCFANSKVKKQAMKSVVKVDISIELQTFDETLESRRVRANICWPYDVYWLDLLDPTEGNYRSEIEKIG